VREGAVEEVGEDLLALGAAAVLGLGLGLGQDERRVCEDRAVTPGREQFALTLGCAWEISIKKALGKLTAPDDLEQQMDEGGFAPLPITIRHGIAAGELPRHHDDPFDRMLICPGIPERHRRTLG
jgi:PIN domain nuclease of toxin-antitoxin system